MKLVGFLFCAVVVAVSTLASSQVATGKPPLGSFSSGPDVINLGNLNAHFDFPVIHKLGRGIPFDYILGFDNSVWTPTNVSGVLKWQPTSNFGWRAITEAAVGYVSYTQVRITCTDPDTFRQFPATQRFNYQYHDPFGTIHNFTNVFGGRPGDTDPSDTASTDSSGYTLHTSGAPMLTAPDGTNITPPIGGGTGAGTRTDRNGNQITTTNGNTFVDTLGATVLSISGGILTPPMVLTYKDTNGKINQ